jgi:hypothetical protein
MPIGVLIAWILCVDHLSPAQTLSAITIAESILGPEHKLELTEGAQQNADAVICEHC